jgi:ABC-type spermidine/putrescine transport system permease subunit I
VLRREREPNTRLWVALAAPGVGWLLLFFLAPLYVVLAIVFGQIDPLFRTAVPVWNPLEWNPEQFLYVLSRIGPGGVYFPALMRTVVFVGAASILCLAIAFPVAYYVSRLAGRSKGVLIALLIAPFWISYMMRMLAWVNLLQNDGLVNRVLNFGGLFHVQVDWLTGQPMVVILGLAYGYVPYMILPLYAGLERLPNSLLEASADLGGKAGRTFRSVVVPMLLPAVIAGSIFTFSLSLGDYVAVKIVGGTTQVIGTVVYDNVSVDLPFSAAMTTVPVVIMVIYLLSVRRSGALENL